MSNYPLLKAAERPMHPVRYKPDLFTMDMQELPLKDTRQHLEFPFFSLSSKPDMVPRTWTDGTNTIDFQPSYTGLPTQNDKDFLIYIISYAMDLLNKGLDLPDGGWLHLSAAEILRFANRQLGGSQYKQLDASLDRLSGALIKTSIKADGKVYDSRFHLIDSATMVRDYDPENGRLRYVKIKLADWIMDALRAKEVLTLHPDFFRLKQPLERRLYEICRKHCGKQKIAWRISTSKLHLKSGAQCSLKQFHHSLRKLIARAPNRSLLDYRLRLDSTHLRHQLLVVKLRSDSYLAAPAPEERLFKDPRFTWMPDMLTGHKLKADHGSEFPTEECLAAYRNWMIDKGDDKPNDNHFISFASTWAHYHYRQEMGMGRNLNPITAATMQQLAYLWWDFEDEDIRNECRNKWSNLRENQLAEVAFANLLPADQPPLPIPRALMIAITALHPTLGFVDEKNLPNLFAGWDSQWPEALRDRGWQYFLLNDWIPNRVE
ncbi:MAG: replication initiator protein A [Paracoccaceae bacterium]|nr:replication initiator protein A [Paracoccaceae bacterium]